MAARRTTDSRRFMNGYQLASNRGRGPAFISVGRPSSSASHSARFDVGVRKQVGESWHTDCPGRHWGECRTCTPWREVGIQWGLVADHDEPGPVEWRGLIGEL